VRSGRRPAADGSDGATRGERTAPSQGRSPGRRRRRAGGRRRRQCLRPVVDLCLRRILARRPAARRGAQDEARVTPRAARVAMWPVLLYSVWSVYSVAVYSVTAYSVAQQTFRSGVDIVRVDALVTDGRKPIAGLAAADFELRDNGVVQTIDSAAPESLPLSLIFVLDTSGSVAGDKMRHMDDAVDLILEGLHADDRAALVTFSHRVWLRTPLMSDFGALRKMMSSAAAAGGTALHDAV